MLVTVVAACRKNEFMPEPQGEKVPYTLTDSTLQQILARPEYGLFSKAWQKSNIEKIMGTWGRNTMFTLLVPDDAAMRAAGLDDAGISSAAKETLDSMLMFHTVVGAVNDKTFGLLSASVGMRTLLLNPVFRERLNPPGTAVSRDSIYRYRQYLALNKEQQLLISGQVVGNAAPIAAKNGTIWKINRVLQPARKNMRQALEDDPRFTLYLEAQRLADSLYETIEGLDPYSMEPFMFYNTVFNTTTAQIDWDCNCSVYTFGNVDRTSLFAPTNDAFIKAGLRTVDDLRALNNRSKPVFRADDYSVQGRSVLDSLLYITSWGRQRIFYSAYVLPMFYDNDLVPEIMQYFDLKTGDYYSPPVASPLEFSKDAGGRVQVQFKGSTAEKATIIGPVIETVQGPIHVTDRLIVPPGFHF